MEDHSTNCPMHRTNYTKRARLKKERYSNVVLLIFDSGVERNDAISERLDRNLVSNHTLVAFLLWNYKVLGLNGEHLIEVYMHFKV